LPNWNNWQKNVQANKNKNSNEWKLKKINKKIVIPRPGGDFIAPGKNTVAGSQKPSCSNQIQHSRSKTYVAHLNLLDHDSCQPYVRIARGKLYH
jgi:hypothetical protein